MKTLLSAILLFMSIQSSASQVFDQEIYLGQEVKFETYSTKTQSNEILAVLEKIDLAQCLKFNDDIVRLTIAGFKVETIKHLPPTDHRYPVHMIELTSVNESGTKRTKSYECPRTW